jgi:hypothetical protein
MRRRTIEYAPLDREEQEMIDVIEKQSLTSDQQIMLAAWQQHTYAEFVLKDADAALATMTEKPYVFLVGSGVYE